ncbi:MAG TPA: mandelate racemase/muconate lactonizing enzyme family protein [Geminicoccaceae bacterium]
MSGEIVRRVTTRLIEREMGGGLRNPRQRWTRKQILLCFVEGEGGEVGVGEAWLSGGSARAIEQTIEDDLAPRVVGRSPFEVTGIAHEVFRTIEMSGRTGATGAAWSAVDMALWDLAARVAGLPLYRMLGAATDRVFAYASAGLYGETKTLDDLASEVLGYVDRGFTAVKMKVGGAPLKEDVERVRVVRETIGADTRLMVDALYNLDVAEAIAMARAFERFDIHFFEAPVSPYDIEGQARVARASPIPICGNENQAWLGYFRRLIDAHAVHYVQFDLAACGGVGEGMRIAHYAQAHHLPITLHASSSSALFAASLHLAAACPNTHSVEYHMLHQWFWDLVPDDAFAPEPGGFLRPPAGPGIGIELRPEDVV